MVRLPANDLLLVTKAVRLLNAGYSLSEASKILGLTASKLSSLIWRHMRRGKIAKHLVVPLNAFGVRLTVAILSANQKVGEPCLKGHFRVITKYYSYAKNLVEVYYLDEEADVVEEAVNGSLCKLEFCDTVSKLLVPVYVSGEKPELALTEAAKPDFCTPCSDVDAVIAVELFRLFNPPITPEVSKTKHLLKLVKQRTGLPNVRTHFYKHVYKCIKKHYAVRGDDFLLLHSYAPSESDFMLLLNNLVEAGFIADLWQILLFSKTPFVAITHAWGYYELFTDPTRAHKKTSNIAYGVYNVLGVEY